MGNLSCASEPVAPLPIKQDALFNQETEALDQFRDNYRNLGFAVIECNDEFMALCQKYTQVCSEWFAKNDFASKKKFVAPKIDDILGRPNLGYLLTPGRKEYLRFKENTQKSLFPTDDIYNQFQLLVEQWRQISQVSMRCVLSEKVMYLDKQAARRKDQKLQQKPDEPSMQLLCDEMDQIEKFGQIHSSISIIHYFKRNDSLDASSESVKNNKKAVEIGKEEEKSGLEGLAGKDSIGSEKIEMNDGEIANRTVEIPLDKHHDTGLMTFILCSDVSGLEMLDRASNKYFKCEPCYYDEKRCHMFVIAGRKMEIFTFKKEIKATWHRVKIPVTEERMSLLYFLEITKEH